MFLLGLGVTQPAQTGLTVIYCLLEQKFHLSHPNKAFQHAVNHSWKSESDFWEGSVARSVLIRQKSGWQEEKELDVFILVLESSPWSWTMTALGETLCFDVVSNRSCCYSWRACLAYCRAVMSSQKWSAWAGGTSLHLWAVSIGVSNLIFSLCAWGWSIINSMYLRSFLRTRSSHVTQASARYSSSSPPCWCHSQRLPLSVLTSFWLLTRGAIYHVRLEGSHVDDSNCVRAFSLRPASFLFPSKWLTPPLQATEK